MRKIWLSLCLCLAAAVFATAQPDNRAKIDTVQLWPAGAPDAFEVPQAMKAFAARMGMDYSQSFMEVYPAEHPNGLCVIMCPGGAYVMQSQTYEGRDLKDWFNARGITYCMLQYRLPYGHHSVPLSDAAQAVRVMRSMAKDLGITQIGIAGNSAGGHLASTLATHYPDAASRPDFQILMYPVITMKEEITNMMSRNALLGNTPSQELVDLYSNERHVTADTPPAFIVLCSDDEVVPPVNSLLYYQSLIDNKVSAEMHIYPSGGHGWGWRDSMIYKGSWVSELETWLQLIVEKNNPEK